MYFDSFLKISALEGQNIEPAVEKLEKVSKAFGVDFILSVSMDESELPDSLKGNIAVSL
jgi:hypothetical protein